MTSPSAAFALFGLLVLALMMLTLRVTPFRTWIAVLGAAPSAVHRSGARVSQRADGGPAA